MPKQRISKTLIIGLGGTGNLALKYAKKRYWETYGKQNGVSFPDFWRTGKFPLVDFLALDTDLKDLKRGIDEKNQISKNGKYKLSPDEYAYLKVSDARAVMKDNPYIRRNWMPDNMVEQCDEIAHGAGQFRAFGRLAITYHIEDIKNRIKNKVNAIHRFENSQNQEYEAASADINVCFCFSVSGGTGAGIFMDLAFIVKEVLEEMNVSSCSQAYVIMPEIFDKVIKHPIKKDKIFGNAYGALREIEFFMSSKSRNYYADKNNNFQVLRTDEYGAEIGYKLDTGRPYDIIHIITNQSSSREGGHIYYTHKHHLMEVVGNNIVLKTGELNDGSSSSWDNIRRVLDNIKIPSGKQHKPRYLTLGYGEMVYNFNEIKDYAISQLSFNLASAIIECNNSHMVSPERIIMKIKQDWKINEHNDGSGDQSDQVLDRIIPAEKANQKVETYVTRLTKKWTLPIEVGKVKDHIDDVRKQYISIAEDQLKLLQNTTVTEIKEYFVGRNGVLDQCGIKPTISGINKLLVDGLFCIDQYSNEMDTELSHEETGAIVILNKAANDVENKIAALQVADNESWWNHDKKVNIALTNLMQSVDSQVDAIKQKLVREYAQRFFGEIESMLNDIKNNLLSFNNNMDLVKERLQKDAKTYLDNLNGQGKRPFTKNVALRYLNDDQMEEQQQISTLLGARVSLYSYVSIPPHSTDKNNLTEIIKNSINSSTTIKQLKNGSVTSYVKKLSNDPEALARVYKELDLMSQPLTDLNLDTCKNKIRYWTPSKLWGVPEDGDHFKYSANHDIEYSITKNHFVLSAESLFYPARIDLFPNIMKYHADYTDLNETVSCDTDKRVTLAMDRLRLSLSGEENTQEKDLFTWCWGFVLYKFSNSIKGIFRKRGNKYKIFSKTLGDTRKNEFSLESQWRHEAFEHFRHNSKLSIELAKEIKKTLQAMSQEERTNLWTSFINEEESPPNTNYIDNFAKPGRDSSDKDPRSEATYKLLEKESALMQHLSDEIMAEYTD